MKQILPIALFSLLTCAAAAQPAVTTVQNRWSIQTDGSIKWTIDNRLPHEDHIEMSGEQVSLWMQYKVDTGRRPVFNRTLVFPTFRLLPVRTVAHMMYDVKDEELPRIVINDKLYKAGVFNASWQNDQPESVVSISHKGIMEIESVIGKDKSLRLRHSFFPSVNKPMAIEKFVFINTGKQAIKLEMEHLYRESSPAETRTSNGPHRFVISTVNDGLKTLQPGDSVTFGISYQAVRGNNKVLPVEINAEEQLRKDRVLQILSRLQLETPDPVLNTMFSFSKIRATESIYNTKGGYLHGPGGLRYYAAIWANDQAEYVNPYFAFSGDDIGNKSAMNAYRWFAKYMNPDFKPIPSSIIAEGDGVWQGAKDRGDMAMIAYGAGRYSLAYGNADSARVLWPLIEWCLEYLSRKINANGVVSSNSDELENRFPAGNANLNTSSLYYDALVSASLLTKELGLPAEKAAAYRQRAAIMKENIEKFFGRTVEGFATYRYYEGNDTLRAWITTPLTVDIFDRKEGTIAALFSPRLWTEDGLASLAGNKTFWDRSTLYGLRGVIAAGETEKALPFLQYYSNRRLLGEHVPYAVEAYPEGNQRHLSAESGLYCRIYTEGLFGIRPTGFRSFNITPHLPKAWNNMALRHINAFGQDFDIEIKRKDGNRVQVKIANKGKQQTYEVENGAMLSVKL